MAFLMLQAFDRHIKSIKKCIFATILKKWILRHFNTWGRRTDAVPNFRETRTAKWNN